MATIPRSVWMATKDDLKFRMILARNKRIKIRAIKKLERQLDLMCLLAELSPQYADPDCKGIYTRIANILGVSNRRISDDIKEIFQGIGKGEANRIAAEKRLKLMGLQEDESDDNN